MGNGICVSSDRVSSVDSEKHKSINHDLKREKRTQAKVVKLLLLGPGESGKSTIFKQMKIITQGQISESERLTYKCIIQSNLISEMKVLIDQSKRLKIDLEKQNHQVASHVERCETYSEELGEMIQKLWKDEGILQTYAQRDTEFNLTDTAEYFFNNIERINQKAYIPTVSDVLRTRCRTTGIEEAVFRIEEFRFRMIDAGGQRCERRKWMSCFSGDIITAIIFCVGISEYDQVLREEKKQNRMTESLMLFDEVVNCNWFRNTNFILFLNKTDLFKEKIKRVSLATYFPTYSGLDDYESATGFIKSRFLELSQHPQSHSVYAHFTCALSTENIKFVFNVVRETVVQKILKVAGIPL